MWKRGILILPKNVTVWGSRDAMFLASVQNTINRVCTAVGEENIKFLIVNFFIQFQLLLVETGECHQDTSF
ncbi:hypothetical protein NIES4075_54400 [Tolypothrix sp. NIES-4075]|nr:hypothetical protein NIES4075_54400 [Tolypothrix sp. NIES-4075]